MRVNVGLMKRTNLVKDCLQLQSLADAVARLLIGLYKIRVRVVFPNQHAPDICV